MVLEYSFGSDSVYPELQPGVLRLYSNRVCPFAKRTRLVLEHKNIPYEIVNINLADKPKWYIEKVSCLGMVPAIQHDDVIVFDSVIVNEYLDAVFPKNKLIPDDPYAAAKTKMFAEIWSRVLRGTGRIFSCSPGTEGNVFPDLLASLDDIENELRLKDTPFFGGQTPMMIDFHMWPHMERIVHYSQLFEECKLEDSRFHHLNGWVKRITSLPAVIKTKTPLDLFQLFYKSLKAGKIDYDIGLSR
ncbi:pyrimidodiazepine synthase-like [Ruditapes philippinarum]|uniref:pyrimidodiazepine synthase-like n=1 Tax=Ruditapes philippinarum TaxID=129788 RepID=UPI00295B7F4C|nr:pyrimidodiazepine synthase-like [Ruditapes philippinarum]